MKTFWFLALLSLFRASTCLTGEEVAESKLATPGQHDGEHTGIVPNVCKIQYAKASEIKRILDEIVSFLGEVKDEFVLDGRLQQETFIRGRFKIVADDRTNQLVILTKKENMRFFLDLVKVFDVEVESRRDVQQTSGGDSTNRADAVRVTPQK